jgi:hypothetical protein
MEDLYMCTKFKALPPLDGPVGEEHASDAERIAVGCDPTEPHGAWCHFWAAEFTRHLFPKAEITIHAIVDDKSHLEQSVDLFFGREHSNCENSGACFKSAFGDAHNPKTKEPLVKTKRALGWHDGVLWPPGEVRRHSRGRPFSVSFSYEQETFPVPIWSDLHLTHWLLRSDAEGKGKYSGGCNPGAQAYADDACHLGLVKSYEAAIV